MGNEICTVTDIPGDIPGDIIPEPEPSNPFLGPYCDLLDALETFGTLAPFIAVAILLCCSCVVCFPCILLCSAGALLLVALSSRG